MTIAVLGVACGAAPAGAQALEKNPDPPAAQSENVSLEQYRDHLADLETLTAACAKGRSKETCDPFLVGEDDRVALGMGAQAQQRMVSFAWLRALFLRAQRPDVADKAGADNDEFRLGPQEISDARTTTHLLEDAQTRLEIDLKQVDTLLGSLPAHDRERAVLQQVLAGSEFRNLKQPDGSESALEKLGNWLNKLFAGLAKLQTGAAWVGRLLFWGFLLLVAVGVAWMLLQLERRWRVRLVPDIDKPAPGAASARDWQLWLKDAREAAARREWREAIHFMYWAAISRLESKKLWPADRARTPREYLALVAGDDPRKSGLGALTREFEWTWYGGRYAGEEEYLRAEELATGLFETGAGR
jgi:hypothetical protein